MTTCLCCGKETTNPKFCSKSCSASYTNRHRKPRSNESKKKTSDSLKGIISPRKGAQTFCKVSFCIMCNTIIKNSYRKTCSDRCKSNRHSESMKLTRRNSKRKFTKSTWHISPFAGTVYLESSWEIKVATILDTNNIRWIRPSYLKYTLNGKRRMYYPDFFLIDYNVYLDPKNSYQQVIDKPKLDAVKAEHNINLLILNEDELNLDSILLLVSETGVAPAR